MPHLDVRLVSNLDDYARVQAIRASVYMTEQLCPFDEEFDGNDFTGSHFLAVLHGEPVGCLRLRYFAQFVKFERLAVREPFRGHGVAHAIVSAALAFCQRKGFRTFYAQAQRRLVPFWSVYGFEPIQTNRALIFSDHEYVEMSAYLPPGESVLTLETDPLVLIRPEGRWDQEGILDRSAGRPATCPHR